MKRNYKSIVQLLAVGFLYSSSFLPIFVRYRNTPVVKSSNIPLTFFLSVAFDVDETESHCLFTSFSYKWKFFEINHSNMDDQNRSDSVGFSDYK